jgi:hypothetical protein
MLTGLDPAVDSGSEIDSHSTTALDLQLAAALAMSHVCFTRQ